MTTSTSPNSPRVPQAGAPIYTHLRFDPGTLQVITGDQTFTASSGTLVQDSVNITAMPFASAMACATSGADGLAVIDLSGTPFHVATAFDVSGVDAYGKVSFSNGDKRANILVRGECGWIAPEGWVDTPYNQQGGQLQLAYDGN